MMGMEISAAIMNSSIKFPHKTKNNSEAGGISSSGTQESHGNHS
jgi:hypothetical protein